MSKAGSRLLLLSVLLATACTPTTGLGLPDRIARGRLTPEHLLAVLPEPEGLGATGEWWPGLPQFNAGLEGPGTLPGERFWVARSFQSMGEGDPIRVETALTLYRDGPAAGRAFEAWASTLDQGGQAVEGPALADEHRYFRRMSPSGRHETTLRLRVGPVAGRVSGFSGAGYLPPEAVAGYSRPVIDRIRALLGGELEAPALDAGLARLLPPEEPGSVLGSAAVPAESWALADPFDDPVRVRDVLRNLGADELGFRRYRLASEPGHVVEATLFPFASEDAALLWLELFRRQGPTETDLDAGQTGGLALFRRSTSGHYQLRFVKGSYAADLLCYAPFSETSTACETGARELAEAWFGALPES